MTRVFSKNLAKNMRIIALIFVAIMLAVTSTGCKITREKAVTLYKNSFSKVRESDSTELNAKINMKVNLDATYSIKMDMSLDGIMSDKEKTADFKIMANAFGEQIPAELSLKNGKGYIKKGSGDFVETDKINYDTIGAFGTSGMKDSYISAIDSAEDLVFSENKDKSVILNFSITEDILKSMQEKVRATMLDELMPKLEKQLREQSKSINPALFGISEEEWAATAEQKISETLELEKSLLSSMTFDKIIIEAIIDKDGFVSHQKMDFTAGINIKALGEVIGIAGEDSDLPEKCTVDMTLDYNVAAI